MKTIKEIEDEIDKLLTEKKSIEETEKLESAKKELEKKEFNTSKYIISEPANVMAIVPIHKDIEIGDEINLSGYANFRRYTGKIISRYNSRFEVEVVTLSKSKYSVEYINQAKRTANAFLKNNKPEFYIEFKEGDFVEDRPCLIVFDRLIFILAPRIEDEE